MSNVQPPTSFASYRPRIVAGSIASWQLREGPNQSQLGKVEQLDEAMIVGLRAVSIDVEGRGSWHREIWIEVMFV